MFEVHGEKEGGASSSTEYHWQFLLEEVKVYIVVDQLRFATSS